VARLTDCDARDARDVSACVVEEHKVHCSVRIVVRIEFFHKSLVKLVHGVNVVVTHFIIEERREAQQLRVLVVELLGYTRVFDVLLDDIGRELEILLDVAFRHQTVAVDALALVHPKLGDLVGIFEVIGSSAEDALEHAGQVADVELVVEVGAGFLELIHDLLVQNECALAESFCLVGHVLVEVLEVVLNEGLVNAHHGLVVGQHDLQDPKVAHEPRVDVEDARSGVHG